MSIPVLHPDTLEEVKQRVEIVEVVSDYVVLKKRGKGFIGLCPFHSEKTPSFNVNPQEGFYFCFGCNEGGDAIRFLMELNKTSFQETVLQLAQRYQVPIRTAEPEQQRAIQRELSLKEQLYEIVAIANAFFQHALGQGEGKLARDYLTQQRGLDGGTIQRFQLGYAPSGWDALYRYLVEQKRYPLGLVEEAGLIKARTSGSGYYDLFRDRLMIPIFDLQGRAIAFGSRTLGDDQPKYLNSPDTPLFAKGQMLFGLDKAKKAIAQRDQVIIVEGYFDVIALHRAGQENVVAALGTAFRAEQLKLALRYSDSKQVVFNFDADGAGLKATQRAIGEVEDLVYSGQVQLRILNLPGGKDADEFLSGGDAPETAIAAYRQALDQAPLWVDWQLQQTIQGQDLTQADQLQEVGKQVVTLLSKIQHHTLRSHYIARAAEIISNGDKHYFQQLQENFIHQIRRRFQKPRRGTDGQELEPLPLAGEQPRQLIAEALLLRLYLHCPDHRGAIRMGLEKHELDFSLSHHRHLWQQIAITEALHHDRLQIDPNALLSLVRDTLANHEQEWGQVAPLFVLNEITSLDLSRGALLIRSALVTLQQLTYEKKKQICYQQWQKSDPQGDRETWQRYGSEFLQIQRQIKALENQRCFSNLDILQYEGEL